MKASRARLNISRESPESHEKHRHPLDREACSSGARMFANRLNKNRKHLSRWRERENIHCYRLYDADIPEYAIAVDVYEGAQRWVHVQEYAAPKSVDERKAQQRLQEALDVVREVLDVTDEQLFVKVRRHQRGGAQYEKLGTSHRFREVIEGSNRFLVNLEDYLDTGLFLDHRITRGLLGELAKGQRFLNLFAYTGSATVYAARGGAAATTTVDLSKTYLDWARRNMALNGLTGPRHELIHANCLEWLEQAAGRHHYGLIFLDPPSFSSSKRMDSTFDVQRDHVALLKKTAQLLEPEGILIFSNNRRHFKLDHDALAELDIDDISRRTLPKDFERNPRIHHCWKIRWPQTKGRGSSQRNIR